MKKILVLAIILVALFLPSANAEFENPVYEDAFIGTIDILYDEDRAYFQATADCEVFAPIGLNGSFSWSKLHITSWEHSIYGAYMDDMEYVGSVHILYDPITDGDRAMWILNEAPEGKILNILYSYNGASSGVLEWSELGLTKDMAEELLEERHRIADESVGGGYTIELDLNNRLLASATDEIRFYSVIADSALSDNYGTYPAENMFDGDFSTAWAEGFEGTDFGGQVETEWEIAQGQWWCEGIALRAGYQKSEQTYYNNSRPKQMQIWIGGGREVYEVELLDYNGWQYVIFEEPILMGESFFDVVICMGASTYKGERYLDTCITEIDLIITPDDSDNPSPTVPMNPIFYMLDAVEYAYGSVLIECATITDDSVIFDLSTENYSYCFLYGTFDGRSADVEELEVCLASYEERRVDIYCSMLEGIYGIPSEESRNPISEALEILSSQPKQEGKADPTVEVALTSQYNVQFASSSGYYYMNVR